MTESYLKRNTSAAIKGIALICMFAHHFFTFPQWYVEGISYPFLSRIAQYFYEPLKMCIPVFAFLTGYFYCFAKSKTLRYSARKIADLLIPHWVVCLAMSAAAMAMGVWQFSVSGFALEMMGLGEAIMMFSWYVAFYCLSMLVLPIVEKLSCGNPVGDIALLLVLPVAAIQCVSVTMAEQFGLHIPVVESCLANLSNWLPCVIVGFLAARYRLFETYFDNLCQKFPGKYAKLLVCLCMIAIGFFGRLAMPRFRFAAIQAAGMWTELVFTMDVFYAPMLIYGMANLLEGCKFPAVIKVLEAIGKQSLHMWFLHALFFNVCKEITQPLIYAPKFPPLVLIFALAVCYGLAVVFHKMVQPLLKLKNRIL